MRLPSVLPSVSQRLESSAGDDTSRIQHARCNGNAVRGTRCRGVAGATRYIHRGLSGRLDRERSGAAESAGLARRVAGIEVGSQQHAPRADGRRLDGAAEHSWVVPAGDHVHRPRSTASRTRASIWRIWMRSAPRQRDVVFVGDNPECDYFGPRAVGIEAFLIAARPVSGVAERHRLAHLYQLSERLS